MKQKSKFRRFWNLDHRKSDGFTLVELIVVIAILAVLGGAAVPSYGLYVKKARESADQQVLAAVNTAFASACLENKIDVQEVGSASISVIKGNVHGLSSLAKAQQAAARNVDPRFNLDVINEAFLRYFEGNENIVFKTENVNSLNWENGAFVISQEYVATRMMTSSGKVITISAEDMEAIMNSAYADLGYSGVKALIDNVGESGQMLANLCSTLTGLEKDGGFLGFGGTWTGNFTGLLPKLTNAMKAFGLIDSAKENEMLKNLCWADDNEKGGYKASEAEKAQSIQEASNGLSMITAKYLASGGSADELLTYNLGSSSSGVLGTMGESGGVKTVSAIAMQYAMAAGFAESEYADGVTVEGKSVSDYLASAEDPVAAINTVKNLDAYKTKYAGSDQYNSDKNGFVGTMSILGDNVGTTSNPGSIDLNDYLANGVESNDAKDILTGVLGE